MYPLIVLLRRRPLRPCLCAMLAVAGLVPLLLGDSTIFAPRPARAADPPPGSGPGHEILLAQEPVTDLATNPPPGSSPTQPPGFEPAGPVASDAQRVDVGIYPTTVYNLDQRSNTFYADLYVWFIWKGDKDPTATMELVNAVEEWGLVQKNIYEKPEVLPDGRFHQEVHVEGCFFQPFSLSRYPLDVHELAILVEDTTYTADELIYVPDKRNSGLGQLLTIPGWDIRGWEMDTLRRRYDTNFGDDSGAAEQFSHLRFVMKIGRPVSFFIWKFLLPLIIVLFLSWSATLIHPENVDVRTAMPATAMLTAMFLQLTYSASLPDLGELVLLDKIYVLVYLLIVVVMAEALVTAHWLRVDEVGGIARARRADRITLAIELVVFVVGSAALIVF